MKALLNKLRRGFSPIEWLSCFSIGLIWSLPTLINQFPLSYFDTAYYLYNSFNLTDPSPVIWRPLTYSYLIRIPIELVGFVGLIVVQTTLIAYFILKASQALLGEFHLRWFFFIALSLTFSPLPVVANFIMPDVFTGLCAVALGGFVYGKPDARLWFLGWAGVFALMHFGNLFIFVPILVWFSSFFRRKIVWAAALGVLMLLTVHFTYFFPTKGIEETAHVFLFSRLVSYQLTEDYFNRHCPSTDNLFCEDREKIFQIWGQPRSETWITYSDRTLPSVVRTNQEILRSSLITVYVMESIKATFEQMLRFARPMGLVVKDDELLRQYLKRSPEAFRSFNNQRLFNGKGFDLELPAVLLQAFYFPVISLCFFVLLGLYWKGALPAPISGLFWLFVLAYFLNSLGTALFSEPLDRYNNRLVWVFPYCLALWVVTRWGMPDKALACERGH